MNEQFIKSKVIAMIVVKQKDTNLALNLQILTKQADLTADDLVSYVVVNDNMAKVGDKLMAMNRANGSSHNLALKARSDQEREIFMNSKR
jgi:guanylate kinase